MLMHITPQTPDVALPLAAYIRRRLPLARHWPREILLGWVRWHLGEGFLGYVTDGPEEGNRRITGATTFLEQDKAIKEYTATASLVTSATTADRTASYVQPSAGTGGQDLAAETYQEDLQSIQDWGAHINDYLNPWQRMAQGAYIGMREGWQGGSYAGWVNGLWGALGGALGGSFQGLTNQADYQWNVSLNQYNIYGVPWQTTAISTGVAAAAGVASAYGGSFLTSTAINAAGQAGENYYRNGGG